MQAAATVSPVRSRLDAAVTAVSLVGAPALLAVLGWQHRWMAEDGFITLRVVRQLESGHGPVFNAGERVEASTSFLWTVLLAVVHLVVRVRLEVLAVGLGLALSVAGLALAAAAARMLWASDGRAVVPLGALVVLALPPFWDFATSGLETGLVFAWLGASGLLLARAATRPWVGGRAWLGAAAVAGLGPLVRPDLALVAGPVLLGLAVLQVGGGCAGLRRDGDEGAAIRRAGGEGTGLRRAVAVMAAGMALPVAYQVFRMGYYGALVPNPGLTKEASATRWSEGLDYVADLVRPYHLWIPAMAVAAVLLAGAVRALRTRPLEDPRRGLVVAALGGGGALHGLYVVKVGGDFMHGRLLLPGIFAVCLPVMVVAPRRLAHGLPALAVAVWAAALLLIVRPSIDPGIPSSGIADERATWVMLTGHPHPVLVEDYGATAFWRDGHAARQRLAGGGTGLGVPFPGQTDLTWFSLRDGLPLGVAVLAGNIGVVGAAAGTNVHVVDSHGLGDRIGAHLVARPDFRVGHEKQLDLAWVWARYLVSKPAEPPGGASTEGVPPAGRVNDAREAMHCGKLRRIVTATTSPLTPRRFLRNITEALSLHGFRFDGDPATARTSLC